jgi:diguanylate cyclase (GGDEF)-like protein
MKTKHHRSKQAFLIAHLISSLCLIILILAGISSRALADAYHPSEPINIDDINDKASVLPFLEFYLDGSHRATINDTLNLPNEKWSKNTLNTQHFGASSAPYWFRFKIARSVLHSDKRYFVKLDYPHHDKVSLYFVNEGEIIKQINTGDHLPFNSRQMDLPTFVFSIPDKYAELDIYISLESQGVLQLPLSIVTQNELSKQNISFSLLTGIYFGAILIMLFYNAFVYLTVRDKGYLYYLLYLGCCAIIQLVLSGLGFQYIWPDHPYINYYAVIIICAFTGISAITFIKNFIGIEYISSTKDIILVKLLVLAFSLSILSGILVSYSFALKSIFICVGILVFSGFYFGVKYWLKGVKTARYFALAWFSALTAVGIFVLENNRIIEPNLFTENALAIGILVELTLLSIAFADRLNYEKDLRVEAQDALLDAQIKMNQDLDRIVKSRTEALEEVNTQLKELSVTDGLTNLKNRYYFDKTFKKEIHRAARDNLSFSVIMIDIDHFKALNDEHGHLYGDYCLSRSAELIKAVVHRPSDTVARYGGEEIAILLPNTPLDGAMKLAEKIREQFKENEFSDEGISTFLTVSIGVSNATPTTDTVKYAIKLLDIADQCLYKAKETGRDRVVGQKCYFENSS